MHMYLHLYPRFQIMGGIQHSFTIKTQPGNKSCEIRSLFFTSRLCFHFLLKPKYDLADTEKLQLYDKTITFCIRNPPPVLHTLAI